jgi:FlaA1/EpsC-like NDP-sugar epimerase
MPQIIFRNKFLLPSLPPPGTFKDKKVLITGASGGLGLAAAVHYVNLGASLVRILGKDSLNASLQFEFPHMPVFLDMLQ